MKSTKVDTRKLVQVRVPAQLADQVKSLRKKNGWTMQDIVTESLYRFMKVEGKRKRVFKLAA